MCEGEVANRGLLTADEADLPCAARAGHSRHVGAVKADRHGVACRSVSERARRTLVDTGWTTDFVVLGRGRDGDSTGCGRACAVDGAAARAGIDGGGPGTRVVDLNTSCADTRPRCRTFHIARGGARRDGDVAFHGEGGGVAVGGHVFAYGAGLERAVRILLEGHRYGSAPLHQAKRPGAVVEGQRHDRIRRVFLPGDTARRPPLSGSLQIRRCGRGICRVDRICDHVFDRARLRHRGIGIFLIVVLSRSASACSQGQAGTQREHRQRTNKELLGHERFLLNERFLSGCVPQSGRLAVAAFLHTRLLAKTKRPAIRFPFRTKKLRHRRQPSAQRFK